MYIDNAIGYLRIDNNMLKVTMSQIFQLWTNLYLGAIQKETDLLV